MSEKIENILDIITEPLFSWYAEQTASSNKYSTENRSRVELFKKSIRDMFEKGNVAGNLKNSGQNTPQSGNHIKARQDVFSHYSDEEIVDGMSECWFLWRWYQAKMKDMPDTRESYEKFRSEALRRMKMKKQTTKPTAGSEGA